jgi:hypothetical protein
VSEFPTPESEQQYLFWADCEHKLHIAAQALRDPNSSLTDAQRVAIEDAARELNFALEMAVLDFDLQDPPTQ